MVYVYMVAMLWILCCYAPLFVDQVNALQQQSERTTTTIAKQLSAEETSLQQYYHRDLIINGTIAPQQRYPFAVYFQDDDFPFCGGSLIAADVVITAAHCIPVDYVGNITVMEGEHNLTDSELGDVVRIRENILHPLYNKEIMNDFDIALTFLERPTAIEKSSLIHLNMNSSYPPDDTIATYLGWGVINTKGEASNILREVDVSVITNEECNSIEGNTGYNNMYFSMNGRITPSMLCTFTQGKDSCQRDSGGPLIVKGADASRDVQIGISSWGVDCASIFPGVASRVSYSWDFIRDNVCNKSSAPPDYFDCPLAPSSSVDQTSSTSHAQKSITGNVAAISVLGIVLFIIM